MYQHLTKLLLAGVVAVILTVGPAHAFHKGVVHGAGGGGETIQTLDSLACASGEIAKFDGGVWECVTDLQNLVNRLSELENLVPRYVFVTSATYTGDLKTQGGGVDGLDGGDKLCQGLADGSAKVPVGTYKAWLSTGSVDARDRIDITFGNYLRTDEVLLAMNGNDLITPAEGVLVDPELDENGVIVGGPLIVWTGTSPAGDNDGRPTCSSWESTAGVGQVGDPDANDTTWTRRAAENENCSVSARLYCFQVLGGN